MKRGYRSSILFGLVAIGPLGIGMARAQTSELANTPAAGPSIRSIGSAQNYGGSPSAFPGGGSSGFPRGDQAAPSAPYASTQGSALNDAASTGIPFPRTAESLAAGNNPPFAGATPSASPKGLPSGGHGLNSPFPSAQGSPLGSSQSGGYPHVQDLANPYAAYGAGAPGPSLDGSALPGVAGAGMMAGMALCPGGIPGGPGGITGAGAYSTFPSGGRGAQSTASPYETPGQLSRSLEDMLANEPPEPAPIPLAGLTSEASAGASAFVAPNVIGDMSPFYSHSPLASAAGPGHSPPLPPGQHGNALFYPSLRNFKVSENQSPRPQDRIFFDYNFYTNVNSTVNTALRSPVNRLNAYVYMWGFEKTFDGGNGSIGMRLPLNTLTGSSTTIYVPASSALGNLDIFAKYILKQNVETGSVLTAGFQISPPTATGRFAGAPYLYGLNTTYLQPFIAYLWRQDRFFVQGFSGFIFPATNSDVSMMYNDISTGYFVYQNPDTSRLVTAIVPSFEVHVNSPLDHRNPFNAFDPAASANATNLTYGLNVMFHGRSMLTAALVTPVSSPKPFDTEFVLFFNYFFGRTVRRPVPITPPVVQ